MADCRKIRPLPCWTPMTSMARQQARESQDDRGSGRSSLQSVLARPKLVTKFARLLTELESISLIGKLVRRDQSHSSRISITPRREFSDHLSRRDAKVTAFCARSFKIPYMLPVLSISRIRSRSGSSLLSTGRGSPSRESRTGAAELTAAEVLNKTEGLLPRER